MTDYSITPPEPKQPDWYEFSCTADAWPLPPVKAPPPLSLWERFCAKADEIFGMGDVR